MKKIISIFHFDLIKNQQACMAQKFLLLKKVYWFSLTETSKF